MKKVLIFIVIIAAGSAYLYRGHLFAQQTASTTQQATAPVLPTIQEEIFDSYVNATKSLQNEIRNVILSSANRSALSGADLTAAMSNLDAQAQALDTKMADIAQAKVAAQGNLRSGASKILETKMNALIEIDQLVNNMLNNPNTQAKLEAARNALRNLRQSINTADIQNLQSKIRSLVSNLTADEKELINNARRQKLEATMAQSIRPFSETDVNKRVEYGSILDAMRNYINTINQAIATLETNNTAFTRLNTLQQSLRRNELLLLLMEDPEKLVDISKAQLIAILLGLNDFSLNNTLDQFPKIN